MTHNVRDVVTIQCQGFEQLPHDVPGLCPLDDIDKELPESRPERLGPKGMALQQYNLEFGSMSPLEAGKHNWDYYVKHMFPIAEQYAEYMRREMKFIGEND